MESEEAEAFVMLKSQLDAMASLLLAVTVTVCRANPRARSKIEEMALQHNLHQSARVQEAGLPKAGFEMERQLQVLLETVRMTLANDARKG